MTTYNLDVLLFLFGTSLLFHVQFCCFLTCLRVSQEAGQVVWYSHLFQNFPQFIVIHTVKGFGIVNKAEIDVFLELCCFFSDPADVGNLISGSSAFSKTSLNIWKFTFCHNVVHWRMEWQTTSVFLPWEPHEQYEKAKRYDTKRWTPQVVRCPICYWTSVEK